jgi:hypothetical protein
MGLPTEWYEGFLPQTAQQEPGASDSTAADAVRGNTAAPVMFVHMPRDEHTAALVAENVESRQAKVRCAPVPTTQPQLACTNPRSPLAAYIDAHPALLGAAAAHVSLCHQPLLTTVVPAATRTPAAPNPPPCRALSAARWRCSPKP